MVQLAFMTTTLHSFRQTQLWSQLYRALRHIRFRSKDRVSCFLQLAFMTTTSDNFRQIQLWSQYHRALGVELFYLFVDGQVVLVRVIEPVPICCSVAAMQPVPQRPGVGALHMSVDGQVRCFLCCSSGWQCQSTAVN